jgi:hypothetical protein
VAHVGEKNTFRLAGRFRVSGKRFNPSVVRKTQYHTHNGQQKKYEVQDAVYVLTQKN